MSWSYIDNDNSLFLECILDIANIQKSMQMKNY